jgi:3-hydroxyisobutyrate dehydrogenase-like beta-hydroxyacid dehydrogenase
MSMNNQAIGIAGLGNVGGPLSVNLLRAGHTVVGYDVKPCQAFSDAGGIPVDLEDLRHAGIVLQSLPRGRVARQVVDELLAGPRQTHTVVDLSSYALADKQAQAQYLSAHGVEMLDCEVSGLPAQVAERRAVIFKSGRQATIDKLATVFDALAQQHFYVGEFGAATRLKLIANTMVCVHNLMAAEALNLGRSAGLDPALIAQVIAPSAAGSTTFTNKVPLMLSREFTTGRGPFRHMFGYLARTQEMAAETGAATPLLAAAQAVYAQAEREGLHDLDIAGVLDVLERQSQSPKPLVKDEQ